VEKIEYGTPKKFAGGVVSKPELKLQEFEVEIISETERAWIRIPEFIVESDLSVADTAGNGLLQSEVGWCH